MSGIVGLVNLDGARVEPAILRELTDGLAFRGPDRQQIRHEGAVGFGHALLANTFGSEHDDQPMVLDDVWIVADARIDGREHLLDELRANGSEPAEDARDAELILRAYHVWGIDCAMHLIGDFAFAIWDAHRRRLMLARDHFGVAPLYYARSGNCIIFSNTLATVRKHPQIRSELNDEAIADFLLFGYSIDLENTFFTRIRSVPPAHRLVWVDGGAARPERFWSLPPREDYHHVTSPVAYAADFRDLLTTAIRDRLRGPRAAIALSGGLDSGAIAAIAAGLRRDGASRTELHSYSIGHDWMVPETERYYAGLTAGAAGIDASYISIEQSVFDGRSRWRAVPEPRLTSVRRSAYDEMYRRMADAGERVVLSGAGGDGLLGASQLEWRKFPVRESMLASARALATYAREYQWIPLNRIIATIRTRPEPPDQRDDFGWLAPDFVRSTGVRERMLRWKSLQARRHHHPQRLASDPYWVAVVSQSDPEFTGIAAKAYHPFFDTRLIGFAMRIAPMPWLIDKMILREAMRGILPEPVRKRRKTSPTAATARIMMSRIGSGGSKETVNLDLISQYIDVSRLRSSLVAPRERRAALSGHRMDILKELDRPVCLAFWLKSIFS